jgi:hypothetical protein
MKEIHKADVSTVGKATEKGVGSEKLSVVGKVIITVRLASCRDHALSVLEKSGLSN